MKIFLIKRKEKPIIFNMWDEGHCPHCDIELHYRAVHEIINEKKKLICGCGGVITPEQDKDENKN